MQYYCYVFAMPCKWKKKRIYTFSFIIICFLFLLYLTCLHTEENIKESKPLKVEQKTKKPLKPQLSKKLLRERSESNYYRGKHKRNKINWCKKLSYCDKEKRGKTALVSFPGSGNTWLRWHKKIDNDYTYF